MDMVMAINMRGKATKNSDKFIKLRGQLLGNFIQT